MLIISLTSHKNVNAKSLSIIPGLNIILQVHIVKSTFMLKLIVQFFLNFERIQEIDQFKITIYKIQIWSAHTIRIYKIHLP